MLTTLVGFLFIFTVIVVCHEAGHFYFAKKSGVLVREFAIGMGPKIFQTVKGETVYTLRILPIGGYVRMAGNESEEQDIKAGMTVTIQFDEQGQVCLLNRQQANQTGVEGTPFQVQNMDLTHKMELTGLLGQEAELQTLSVSKTARIIEEDGTEVLVAPIERQLQSAKLWHRMLINFAGPLNNFILAVIVFILVAFLRGGVVSNANTIGQVVDQSPAQAAGLQNGDSIQSIDGQPTSTWDAILEQITQKPDQTIALEIERDGKVQTVAIHTNAIQVGDQVRGQIGIVAPLETSFLAKISYGFTAAWAVATGVFATLGSLFTKGFSLDQFGGPVAMYSLTSQVVQNGFIQVLNLMAILSVNLGIMNLLPIPALDGGKLVLNAIEGIRGKPLNPEKEMYITVAGAILLLILMIAVTWNDVMKLFH